MRKLSMEATLRPGPWWLSTLTAGLIFWAASASTASAALVLSPVAPTISGGPNSVGNFEVTVTNTGPENILLTSFSLAVSVADTSGVLFDSATTSTSAPYVFEGIGFVEVFGFPFIISPDPVPATFSSFVVLDLAFDEPYRLILPSETFGIARISYVLGSNGASGVPVTMEFVPLFDTAPVPEPASLVQTVIGLACAAAGLRRAARRRCQAA